MGIIFIGWGIKGVFFAGAFCSVAISMLLVAVGK
jgi:hypothetical protein